MALWKNSDGKIIVNGDGKPIDCDHCPCGCASTEVITAVFSGVNPCSDCYYGCAYCIGVKYSGSIPGMFTLNVNSESPNEWDGYIDEGGISVQGFAFPSSRGCDNPIGDPSSIGGLSAFAYCSPNGIGPCTGGRCFDWSIGIMNESNAVFIAKGYGALPRGVPVSNQADCSLGMVASGGTVTLSW